MALARCGPVTAAPGQSPSLESGETRLSGGANTVRDGTSRASITPKFGANLGNTSKRLKPSDAAIVQAREPSETSPSWREAGNTGGPARTALN